MAETTQERAMRKMDALIAMHQALDELGERYVAIGKLCDAAIELNRWGRTLDLHIHSLSREAFDSFDVAEKHFPPTKTRAREFWSKDVILHNGGYTPEDGTEGRVLLTLYTDDPPEAEAR